MSNLREFAFDGVENGLQKGSLLLEGPQPFTTYGNFTLSKIQNDNSNVEGMIDFVPEIC